MTLRARILASSVAAMMLAAACGSGTGEAPAATTAATSAPAATAAKANLAKPLVVLGDTIRSNYQLNETEIKTTAPGIHCTQQSRFPQGGRIVWRMKVLDPVTGSYLSDKDLTSFTITYPDGKTDKLAYGGHGGTKEAPQDMLWAVGYTIPVDYPTGAFNVKIEAKANDGRVGTFDQFKVTFAQLMIVPKGQDYPRN